MGTKILNGLPIKLKNEINLNLFKRTLKGYLMYNVFYSLQEFLKSNGMDCRWKNLPVLFLMFFIFMLLMSSTVVNVD
jgi:lipopolysaccharide export LptBFGC system permease protein LptF